MKNRVSVSVTSFAFLFYHFFLLPASALDIPLTIEESPGLARTSESRTSGVLLSSNIQTATWALFDGTPQILVRITRLPGRVPGAC